MRTERLLFAKLALCLCIFGHSVVAQTTQFTYQGRLTDGSLAGNASYDFEFTLYDAATLGTPLGTNQRFGVVVSSGIFTVVLDFPGEFDGDDRWLEIAVRPTGGPSFTTLGPRQPVSSAPYSIRSLNAATANVSTDTLNVGGTPAAQIIKEGDTRLTNARTPTPGSSDYIQNQNTEPQGLANFNISGTGTANIFDAGTQFNIGSLRVLSVSNGSNIFAGLDAGTANSTGRNNSFFGVNSGRLNTLGTDNTFIGSFTGRRNASGNGNVFVGNLAGAENITGIDNTFIGNNAGAASTASANTFVGAAAGLSNTTGTNNLFLGASAGRNNTTGSGNTLIGVDAGQQNSASNSTFVGKSAGQSNTTGGNNTFVGESAGFSNTTGNSNSFFGLGAGRNNVSGVTNSFFGVSAGLDNVSGTGLAFFGANAGSGNTANLNSFFGSDAGRFNTTGSNNTFVGNRAGLANLTGAGNTFVGSSAGRENTASHNTFVGTNSGRANSTGEGNTFVGSLAGRSNTASNNSFFGFNSGINTIDGARNTFIGSSAGAGNTSGSFNVFVGDNAGLANTTSTLNTFVGFSSGFDNLTGANNAFIGQRAGRFNTSGNNNTFLGQLAGSQNTTGSNNVALGSGSGFSTGALSFATAIGPGTIVGSNNTIQLGRITQEESVLIPGDLQVNGTITGNFDLPAGSGNYIQNLSSGIQSGSNFHISGLGQADSFNARTAFEVANEPVLIRSVNDIWLQNLLPNGGIELRSEPTVSALYISPNSFIRIRQAPGGVGPVCLNANFLADCSSSIRYKENIVDYPYGSNLLSRFRPVSFNWKSDGKRDLGLIAEEVAEIDPLLVTYNDKGQVEGVKYDRIGVVLINVVKEQQRQIDDQRNEINQLKALICQLRPDAAVCR